MISGDASPETDPLREQTHAVPTTTGVADPSITFIKPGKFFGLLLADSADPASADGRVTLRNVRWVERSPGRTLWRRLLPKTYVYSRRFPEVHLVRDPSGLHVAQDAGSTRLFPIPSADPYETVFLAQSRCEEFRRAVAVAQVEELVNLIAATLQTNDVLRFRRTKLIAPPTYAAAKRVKADHDLLASP